jgi:hypothetical protein
LILGRIEYSDICVRCHVRNRHQTLLVGHIGEDEIDGHVAHMGENSNSCVVPTERA